MFYRSIAIVFNELLYSSKISVDFCFRLELSTKILSSCQIFFKELKNGFLSSLLQGSKTASLRSICYILSKYIA